MILTPDERSRSHVEAGVWSRVTLDQVFRKGLLATPDDIVFRDVGSAAVPGIGAALTFAEAERRIEGLAAFFAGLGLKPDMVIGIHLPACADATVIALAAIRAGLVVCPLPLHWTRAEIEAAVQAAAIRGIVTASEVEEDPSGELIRDVAAETFAIRFVFAVGRGMPDGLIDLADVLAEVDSLGPAPEILRRGSAADHVALLSFAVSTDDKLLVVPFSHNHIVATALAHVLEAGIDRSETLLSTMHPASLAGLAGGVVTALVGGGSVAFHHPTSLAGLVEAVVACEADRVVLPAPFGPALAAACGAPVALSLVSSGQEPTAPVPVDSALQVVDLTTLCGLCLLPRARDVDGAPAALPAGPGVVPSHSGAGPVMYETRVKPRVRAGDRRPTGTAGELILSGALIPDAPWPEPASGGSGAVLSFTADGQLRTGLQAEIAGDSLRLAAAAPDAVVVAGRPISAARLDGLFRRHPDVEDAAVFALDGGPVGSRLGVAVVPKAGRRLSLVDLLLWLDGQPAGALDRPSTVIAVPEIPRGADGAVLRQALFLKAVA
jgi:non-ribosomal peptide synthetase component E (peptide arylation enzyme)